MNKNSSFNNIEDVEDEEENGLNTTQKSSKSQQYISSTKKSELSRSVHASKNPNKNPEFSIPPNNEPSKFLNTKTKEAASKIEQLEKEVVDNEIKFMSQPILLLNIDNDGKILLNKKALHLLKKITNYVK